MQATANYPNYGNNIIIIIIITIIILYVGEPGHEKNWITISTSTEKLHRQTASSNATEPGWPLSSLSRKEGMKGLLTVVTWRHHKTSYMTIINPPLFHARHSFWRQKVNGRTTYGNGLRGHRGQICWLGSFTQCNEAGMSLWSHHQRSWTEKSPQELEASTSVSLNPSNHKSSRQAQVWV